MVQMMTTMLKKKKKKKKKKKQKIGRRPFGACWTPSKGGYIDKDPIPINKF
jgi:hypothetical protein